MAFSIVPFVGMICFSVSVAYPTYKTFSLLVKSSLKNRAVSNLEGKAKAQNEEEKVERIQMNEYVQWLMYWIIFSIYTFLESYVLFILPAYIPLYLEMKTLMFLWLGYTQFKGAGWLWYAVLEKQHKSVDDLIQSFFYKYCPSTILPFLVVAQSDEEDNDKRHAVLFSNSKKKE